MAETEQQAEKVSETVDKAEGQAEEKETKSPVAAETVGKAAADETEEKAAKPSEASESKLTEEPPSSLESKIIRQIEVVTLIFVEGTILFDSAVLLWRPEPPTRQTPTEADC